MTTDEVWCVHPVLTDYEVSDAGRVRRCTPCKGTRVGRLKTPYVTKNGYCVVMIEAKPRKVHVLVLEAFVGPRPQGLDGCHSDGVRTNNVLSNLRWATRQENMADAKAHGTAAIGRQKLAAYWADPANRAAQAERTRTFKERDPEGYAAARAAQRAALRSPETRAKMRQAKLGTRQSPETIAKRKAALASHKEQR